MVITCQENFQEDSNYSKHIDKFNFELSLTLPTSDKSYLSELKYRFLNISSAISTVGASPGRKIL